MKKANKKVIGISVAILVFVITLVCVLFKVQSDLKASKMNDFEHLRSMEYAVVTDDDIKVENCDNVTFSAFFTRDLDGDGYAERLNGTCKELGNSDVLYMDINVFSEGRLENAKITLNSSNFKWTTSLVKDNIIDADYLGETNSVSFKTLQSGTQKLLWGTISDNIGNNINNYSKVNSVTLTGDYYDNSNHKTTITKTVEFTVDWYGYTSTNVNQYYTTLYNNQTYSISSLLKDDKTVVKFIASVAETQEKLLLQKQVVELEIPKFRDYSPINVKVTDNNIRYEYDEETGKLTITREAKVSQNGNITSSISRKNLYNVEVTYPKEAYDSINENIITVSIPIKGYNYGYNNGNVQVSNPHVSNKQSTINLKYDRKDGKIWDLKPYIGTYSYNPIDHIYKYIVSKEIPDNIYLGNEAQNEGPDTYPVSWRVWVNDSSYIQTITLEEKNSSDEIRPDLFLSNENNISAINIVKTVNISFSGAVEVLGQAGWIDLYDGESGELIKRFTKADWKNPYDVNLDTIKIVTSTPVGNGELYIKQTKEINDDILTNLVSKEKFDKLYAINTYVKGFITLKDGSSFTGDAYIANYASASYQNKISLQRLTCDIQEITNQENSVINLGIETNSNEFSQSYWKNGEFLIELPQEIINARINSIKSSNPGVKIKNYNIYEENNKYYIRISAENETDIPSFTIKLGIIITPNPTLATALNKVIKLYAYNDICNNYYSKTTDIYDMDNDGITSDDIGYSSVSLNIIAPSGLITSEYISNYNGTDDVVIAPNVASIDTTDVNCDRKATVNVTLSNNYHGAISEIEILGNIPFEGNKKIITNVDMESEFNAKLTGPINVPSNLLSYATVYYSTKENPNKNLDDYSNNWVNKNQVSDWSKVKSYLVKLNSYSLRQDEVEVFSYVIEVPENVPNNAVSYSNHAVYYCLESQNGKLETNTEPNKVGVASVETYNIDVNKIKFGYSDILVAGATYSVSTTDYEGNVISKIATTDENGYLKFEKLYLDKEYSLKEISAPNGYALSNEEIKFIATKDESDNFVFNLLSGRVENEITPTDDTDGRKLVSLVLADEAEFSLEINKKSSNGENIENVRFLISGKNANKFVKTDSNGIGVIDGLSPNYEYTIREVEAEGYYMDSEPIVFKLKRNDSDELFIESENDISEISSVTDGGKDETTVVNFNLINEPIQRFNLKIVKVEENSKEDNLENLKKLPNANYNIESIDSGDLTDYTTNENGEIDINDLYLYVPGKTIKGWYTIKELSAPEGYCINTEDINVRVSKDNENKFDVEILNKGDLSSFKGIITNEEENTVTLILQDKPLFKLTKVDSETGEPLPNTEFIVYEINREGQVIDYAKDLNGDYIGTLKESGDYVVTTDENGIIILPLRNGLYEILEVGYPEGYMEKANSEIFKINDGAQSTAEDTEFTAYDYSKITEINNIEDLVNLSLYINSEINSENNILTNSTPEDIKLMRTLDFNDDTSYEDSTRTDYGDLNGDGTIESIKLELTRGKGFTTIGNNIMSVFSGNFDGQNYEIKNLYIDSEDYYVGLFGNTKNAVIKNLGVTGNINVEKDAGVQVGGIVAKGASIDNCYSKVDINVHTTAGCASIYVGGIIGYLDEDDYIKDCYNENSIFARCEGERSVTYVAGIVGYAPYSSSTYNIYNCYNTANITGISDGCYSYTGGISGYNGEIYNCYNTGNIYCESIFIGIEAGGICGCSGTAKNCYNTGNVYGYINKDNLKPDSKVGSFRYDKISYSYIYVYVGGIGGSCSAYNSYNTGDVITNICTELNIDDYENWNPKIWNAQSRVGGITGYSYAENVYNTGNVSIISKNDYPETSYTEIGGITGCGNAKNAYNLGNVNIECVNYGGDCVGKSGPIMASENDCENCYYLSSLDVNGDDILYSGEAKSQSEMKTSDFVELLGEDNWSVDNNVNDGYPILNGNEAEQEESHTSETIEISKIEDLMDFAISVNTGNDYKGSTILLNNDLDFNDSNSYENSQTIEYGDINGNGEIEPLITELTTEKGFLPIGLTKATQGYEKSSFKGIFDGQNHEIKNLYIANRTDIAVGLFGNTDRVTIKNIGVSGKITNGTYIGGLVGRTNYNTNIDNCYTDIEIVGNDIEYNNIGGLIGYADDYTNIANCHSDGLITVYSNKSSVGGLIGYCDSASVIKYCYNNANIICEPTTFSRYLGGIVGSLSSGSTMEKCYNKGVLKASGVNEVGGICGEKYYSGTIKNCYNIGQIEADNCKNVGGLIGFSSNNNVKLISSYNAASIVSEENSNQNEGYLVGSDFKYIYNSYYLNSIELSSSSQYEQGVSKSNEEMKSENFVRLLGISNWKEDDNDTNNGYPIFMTNTEIEERVAEKVTEIYTIEDLLDFSLSLELGADYENTEVILMNDLDFNNDNSYENPNRTDYGDINENEIVESLKTELTTGKGYNPIGGHSESEFNGIFNGNNKKISNLCINRDNMYLGLFGKINHAKIKDLGLSGEITGNEITSMYLGGLVAYAENSVIDNCYNECSINGYIYVGGLVCYTDKYTQIKNSYNIGAISSECEEELDYNVYIGGISASCDGKIENCYNSGIITYNRCVNWAYIAGISGSGINIKNCYNSADLNATNTTSEDHAIYVGGIVSSRYYYSEEGMNIDNCYNTGNILGNEKVNAGGIIADAYTDYYTGYAMNNYDIINCYNTGTINAGGYIGGIVGCGSSYSTLTIKDCYNTGSILNGKHSGGIAGNYSGNIYKCYNIGTVTATDIAGGIVGEANYTCNINNTYNVGIVNSTNKAAGILGTTYASNNFTTVKNSYNVGLVTANSLAGNIFAERGTSEYYGDYSSFDESTLYYLNNNISGAEINTLGTPVTDEQLKSEEIYNNLNTDGVWVFKRVDYPKFTGYIMDDLDDVLELTIENTIKKYNITTRVEGNLGGTISGQDDIVYEVINYNENNQKAIEIRPEDGYIITKIVINGKNLSFEAADDGSYIIPVDYFKNVQENKNIVVSFASLERTLTVNKVDEADETIKLSGAKFNVESNIKDNIQTVEDVEVDVSREITDSMQSNGSYYFTKSNNVYIPNNKGSHNTTANSYIKIDLTGKTGKYNAIVNASVSSESSYDFGYATITTSTSAPSYSDSNGQFMKISGSVNAKNYKSKDLIGGNIYYLHLGYRKDSSANSGNDQVVINSVILEPQITKIYGFVENDGKISSNNQGEDNKTVNTYCPVDLTNVSGTVKVKVNAEISSEENDYGYVIITDSDSEPSYNQTEGRVLFISGEVAANTYEYTLSGGQMYYIHFGYYKDDSNSEGTDTFTINNVELDYGDIITADNGKAQIGVETGNYTVREIEAPEGYTLNSEPQNIEISYLGTNELTFTNKKQTILNVHHYFKNGNGEYTQIKVAEDETYKGDIGSTYTTSPRMDLEGLTLEKDESNNYKIPANATSTYGEDEINVNYYYEASKVKLTIHHYLLGTENKLKEDDEIEVNGNIIFDDEGNYTISTESEYDLDSNEKYTELLDDYILMNVISSEQGILNIEDNYTYNTNSEVIYYYDVDSIGVTEQKVWKNLNNETAKNYRSTFRVYEGIETAETQNEIIDVNEKQYALLENISEQVVVGNGNVNLNLPKYAGQTEREYILVETKAEKFDSTNNVWIELTEGEQYRKTEVENTTTNEALTKSVKEVVWKDATDEIANNYKSTLKLYRDAEEGENAVEIDGHRYVEIDNQTVTGNGQVEFENLPLYDENSKEINYSIIETVVEKNDGDNWITLTEGVDYEVNDNLAKVENTLLRNYKIKKQWNLTNYENYRATFNLYKTINSNKELIESKVIRGNGTATFENLYVYKEGVEIEYSVEEVKVERTQDNGNTWSDVDIQGFRISHSQTDEYDDLITNAISGEFGLNINKTEDKEGKALSGAKFNVSIKDEEETELVDLSKEYITGADGSLVNAISELAITGVGKTYTVTITEDGNVDGYKALGGPIEFTVNTRVNSQLSTNELVPETKAVDNTKGVIITENLITVNIENEWDTGYKVKYYYDDVLEETEEFEAKYGDTIDTYTAKPKYDMVLDKVTTSNNGTVGELPLTIGEDKDKNIINVYYKTVLTIEAGVTEHNETYKDGTSQTVNGGAIYEDENTLYETEEVMSGNDSSKYIIIKPDEGYIISRVTITDNGETTDLSIESFVRDDGKIILSKDNGFFENVTSSKKINAEFRKKSKVTVKYLEKDTETELSTQDIIEGYDGKDFATQRAVVTGYRNAEIEINANETSSETYDDMTKYDENAENKMKAYDITVIYWYEEVPKGTVIVRYIEIDDEDIRNGLTLNSGREIVINDSTIVKAFGLDDANEDGESTKEQYEDYVGTEINTERKEFVDNETGRAYKSVDGPVSNDSNIVIVGKDTNSYNTTIQENDLNQDGNVDVVEIRYYYERDYVISTAVKTHDENGVEVKGGNISGEDSEEYEIVNRNGSNKKVIEVNPDENYHIKSLVINDQEIDYENMKDENGNVKFDLNYFNNIIENKKVVVEYEKNLINVVIKYINEETGEEITTRTIKKFEIGKEYEVGAKDIDGYTRIESKDPTNYKGIAGLNDIEVIYYYSKNATTENEPTEQEDNPTDPEVPENSETNNEQEENEIIENGGGTVEDTESKEAKVEITYTEHVEDESTEVPQNVIKIAKAKNAKTNDNIIVYVVTLIISTCVIVYTTIKIKKS